MKRVYISKVPPVSELWIFNKIWEDIYAVLSGVSL